VSDSRNQRILRGEPNDLGWVDLEIAPGEKLIGDAPSADAVPLLTFIHISDFHLCDAQSPARVELMDRFADGAICWCLSRTRDPDDPDP
jgi:hypothetical protein